MMDHVEMTYRKGTVDWLLRDYLLMEENDLCLPAGCVEKAHEMCFYFYIEGYREISTVGMVPASRILKWVIQLIGKLYSAQLYYIRPERIRIDPDRIYVGVMKPHKDDVRILFVPEPEGETPPVREKLAVLIEDLIPNCEEDGRGYLRKAAEIIRKGRSGLRIMVHRLDLLRTLHALPVHAGGGSRRTPCSGRSPRSRILFRKSGIRTSAAGRTFRFPNRTHCGSALPLDLGGSLPRNC